MAAETLCLVDGSSYLFRAFHALPPLTNAQGEPTGALYGVANMLRRMMREEKPTHVAIIFDAPGKTFRSDMYPDYKATRPPMPDELRVQIEPLKKLVEAEGYPLLCVPDVEADDVIATLARAASRRGLRTVVSTSDKDLAQLVDDHVELVNTMTDTRMDADGVKNKFGVWPNQIIDYLTLVGDTVDNVPGVNKVGPKTAAKWLDQYGDLDAIMADAESFKGKIGEYLREALGHLPLSRQLVTVKDDVELDLTIDDLDMRPADPEKLADYYERWGFKTWRRELAETSDDVAPVEEAPPPEKDYELVLDEDRFADWVAQLEKADVIAFDTETDSTDPNRAVMCGLSFAVEAGKAAYVPFGHVYPGAPKQLDRDFVLDRLKPILEDPAKTIVGQHFKYDLIMLQRLGIDVPGFRFDTMLESYVLDSTAGRHDMDSLAGRILERETIHYEDVAGKGAKQITFPEVGLEEATPYAAEDADVTLQLHAKLWPQLADQEGPRAVFESIEMPLAPVLARVEQTGVLVNAERLAKLSNEFATRMAALEQEAHEAAGQPFNIGSPRQLGEILFEKLEIPVIRKTPKGAPSTAEDVLQELAREHELPRIIMDYRALSKLKSTYTDKLPEQINPATGRIHTSYHQAVAATGRLSSTDPNLQNIPIRNDEGRRIRRAFVAPDGFRIVAADYSQIELRIMAHLSGDDGLREAFREGKDIHAATAAEVFGGTPDTVDPDDRRKAKAINFGLIYGMSAFGLSKQLEVERKEAQAYIDLYFSRYPGVKQYMEETREKARAQGYVETVFGRRLYLPEIKSRNFQRRQGAERAAINAPMQGTAADIIKRAMLDVDAWIRNGREQDVRMTMQVHDELVFEIAEAKVEACSAAIAGIMQGAADLSVPLVVEADSGENWDQAH